MSQDPVHSMHINVALKIEVSGPKNWPEEPQNCPKKSEKKLVTDVLKNPKTSLERIRVAVNAFFCYDTISRGTIRQILKQYGVLSTNSSKKFSLKKKSKCLCSKWCINMQTKSFYFWQIFVFSDETRVRISNDVIVRVFRRNGTKFHKKKHKNLSSHKRSLMFWDAIRSYVLKLLV